VAKKVTITMQNKEPEEILVDEFNLKTDYYDYVLGNVKDANGNQVQGVMIGENKYVRLLEVVEIKVEDVELDGR